jgi:hypothetical protein
MEQYITELANDIAKCCPDLVESGCGNDNCVACLAFKLIGLGYQKQSDTADVVPKMWDALESIIWYDGHYEWLRTMRDDMEDLLKSDDKYVNYCYPFDTTEWHSEKHTIYMLLVGMFGDWGTSIRSGWIEDIEGCVAFINAVCRESWEEMKSQLET